MLYNQKDIIAKVHQQGFLPFFAGEVENFSIEEEIAPEFWFPDDDAMMGVWGWKNDIIIDGDCAYGKFYAGKACFVSMRWFPHLVNWRRAGYRPSPDEQLLLDTVRAHGSLLSREMKKLCGYMSPPRRRVSNPVERMATKEAPRPKAERKGFDSALTRLQMGGALLSASFEYSYTRDGRPYGWSVGRYCTPEDFFGAERMAVDCTPAESRSLLEDHLMLVLPQASMRQIEKIVG